MKRKTVPQARNTKRRSFLNADERGYYADSISEFVKKIDKIATDDNKPRMIYKLGEFFAENDSHMLGHGSFRAVFSFDDDLIVKVASPRLSSISDGIKMNKLEFDSIQGMKYPDIVPRVYKFDKHNSLWSIQEKIAREIQDPSEFMDFFQNFSECISITNNKFSLDDSKRNDWTDYSLFRDVTSLMDKYELNQTNEMILNGQFKIGRIKPPPSPSGPETVSVIRESKWYDYLFEEVSPEAQARADYAEYAQERAQASRERNIKERQGSYEASSYFLKLYFKNMDEVLHKIYYNAKVAKAQQLKRKHQASAKGQYMSAGTFQIYDTRTHNVGVDKDGNFKLLDTGFGL